MRGWDIRERRRSAGLTLRQVARAAGTSESNLSAYERDAKRPNAKTLRRVLAAVDAGASSPVHAMNLMTVPATAAALRAGIKLGWPVADLLRLVREMRNNAAFATSDVDRAIFLAEPSTTGDRRWDVLLAGCVEDMEMKSGRVPPEWTRSGALPEFWFPGSTPSLRGYAFGYSPFSLQIRGVMLDPASLESV